MAQSFSPIQSRIQKTLFDKMSMLEKQSSVISREKDASGNLKSSKTSNYRIGSPLSTQTGNAKQNYMMGRSTWMRMVSLEVPASGAPVILMGGEADSQGNFVGNLWGKKTGATSTSGGWTYNGNTYSTHALAFGAAMKGGASAQANGAVKVGEPIITPEELQHGRYWTEGESQPFRPSPGIKDIRVEHKLMSQAGGGAPTRTTEINWICWTWQDLDRLTKHFLPWRVTGSRVI